MRELKNIRNNEKKFIERNKKEFDYLINLEILFECFKIF